MAWTVSISLDADKTEDGNSVGVAVGTFADAELFVTPFSVSERFNFKNDFAAISKRFKDALTAETNRRQVAFKVASVLESELNQ